VQTTERYLGCKQNLGHPVNDLFDLRTADEPEEESIESSTVTGSTPMEGMSRQGIECHHGGSEHDQSEDKLRSIRSFARILAQDAA
jgi:hypothetical protein